MFDRCSISPCLFSLVIDEVMEVALEDLQDVGFELTNERKLCDLGRVCLNLRKTRNLH